LPFGEATTRIDDGNAAIADHKTDVRNLLTFKYDGSMPGPNVNTRSHLHDLSRFRAVCRRPYIDRAAGNRAKYASQLYRQ
jgi:hypothetical protein